MTEIKITLHRINGKVVYRAPEHKDVKAERVIPDEIVQEVAKSSHLTSASKATGVTKFDRAVALYKSAEDKSRKAIIALFVKELQMTPAGASTYQYTVKKQIDAEAIASAMRTK